MARYFNKTRGLVTVSLRDGSPAVVAPKAILTVTPEQDRSASILSRVRKELLIPLRDETPPASPEAPAEEPPAPEPEKEEAPSMTWTKSRLMEHAEAQGLEVQSGWTKVEILEAIEGAE